MKKQQRILKNHEFSRLISRRKRAHSPSFILYYSRKEKEKARMGISVSKKLGNAVVRNRIKRQVRSMADQAFNFSGDLDVIAIIRPPFLQHSFEENLQELKTQLDSLKRDHPGKRRKEKE